MQLNFIEKQSTQTPITYTGGKRIIYNRIMDLIPAGTTDIVSPFAGAAGLELKLAASGYRVHCFDIFPPNAHFFSVFNGASQRVATIAQEIFPLSNEDFRRYGSGNGEHWHAIECPYMKAAVYWVASRQGYAGRNFSSTPANRDIERRRSYFKRTHWDHWRNTNFTYREQDYQTTFAQYPETLMYCDPPYVERSQYYGWYGGQPEFDHKALRDTIATHNAPVIISYAPHPLVYELYADYPIIRLEWRRTMSAVKKHGKTMLQELLILKDIPPPTWAQIETT